MDRETIILITLIAYKAVLLALGFLGARRTKDEGDFYLAGRQLGPIVAALSAAASSSSAWTILGVSGLAYSVGLSALWLFPACVGGFLLNWYVLAPALRRKSEASGALTLTDMLAPDRTLAAHRRVRTFASILTAASLGLYVSFQFKAAGVAFSRTFADISPETSILIGGSIVLAYTLMGGFWAASLTDTLQGMLMVACAIALPLAALTEVGGFAALSHGLGQVPVAGFDSLFGSWEWPLSIGFIIGILGIGLGYPGQPHVVNRLMALKNAGPALVQARRISIGWAILVYGGMLLLGLCGRILIPIASDHESLFVELAHLLLHPIFAGLTIAALLSAIMSTADSQLLSAASAITHDLPRQPRTQDSRSLLSESRMMVLLLGGLAMALALTVDEKIFSGVLFAWGTLGAAFGPALLVTVSLGALPMGHTAVAMALGAGLSISAYFMKLPAELKAVENVLPFVVSLCVCLLGIQSARRRTQI
jgi:sodium/proline symporter